MPDKAATPRPQTFGQIVRTARLAEQPRLSQRALITRLAEQGTPMTQQALARLERHAGTDQEPGMAYIYIAALVRALGLPEQETLAAYEQGRKMIRSAKGGEAVEMPYSNSGGTLVAGAGPPATKTATSTSVVPAQLQRPQARSRRIAAEKPKEDLCPRCKGLSAAALNVARLYEKLPEAGKRAVWAALQQQQQATEKV